MKWCRDGLVDMYFLNKYEYWDWVFKNGIRVRKCDIFVISVEGVGVGRFLKFID